MNFFRIIRVQHKAVHQSRSAFLFNRTTKKRVQRPLTRQPNVSLPDYSFLQPCTSGVYHAFMVCQLLCFCRFISPTTSVNKYNFISVTCVWINTSSAYSNIHFNLTLFAIGRDTARLNNREPCNLTDSETICWNFPVKDDTRTFIKIMLLNHLHITCLTWVETYQYYFPMATMLLAYSLTC